PKLEQPRNQRWRVLQIAIELDDGVAARVEVAGQDGRLKPKVAREAQHANRWIAPGQFAEQRESAIGAVIVGEKQLKAVAVRERFTQLNHGRVQLGDVGLLIEHRHTNRDQFPSIHGDLRSQESGVRSQEETENGELQISNFKLKGKPAFQFAICNC